MTRALTLLDLTTRIALYGSCTALFLILGCYVFEVVVRYFLNTPTTWSNDVIQLLFAAMIMLAVPEVTRQKSHIVISFFLEKMPDTTLDKVERWIALAGAALCFFAGTICFEESLRQFEQGIQTLWNTPVPKWWISGFLPFGFFLSGLQFLRNGLLGKKDRP